jgi:hypothetical protein
MPAWFAPAELNRGVWESAWELLSPTLEVVAVYYRQRFCLLRWPNTAASRWRLPSRFAANLRDRLRQIERAQYSLMEDARPP